MSFERLRKLAEGDEYLSEMKNERYFMENIDRKLVLALIDEIEAARAMADFSYPLGISDTEVNNKFDALQNQYKQARSVTNEILGGGA